MMKMVKIFLFYSLLFPTDTTDGERFFEVLRELKMIHSSPREEISELNIHWSGIAGKLFRTEPSR